MISNKEPHNELQVLSVMLIIAVVAASVVFSMNKEVAPTTGAALTGTPYCDDSDGGYNIYLKGTITYGSANDVNLITANAVATGSSIQKTDFCRNVTSNTLVEYWCNKAKPASNDTVCQYGCTDGACNRAPLCGNGVIEGPEQCDGTNLAGQTCQSKGFTSGTLSCYAPGTASSCTFNTAGCYNIANTCLDSDGYGNFYSSGYVMTNSSNGTTFYYDSCSGSVSIDQTCSGNYYGGTTTYNCPYGCSSNGVCNPVNNSVCGNAIVEAGEQCDLGANNGACPKICSSSCTLNTCNNQSNTTPICGNGIKEIYEQCDNGVNNGACPKTCGMNCISNVCTNATCTDSDGGRYGYVYGYTTGVLTDGSSYTRYDSCVNSMQVQEAYCTKGTPYYGYNSCDSGFYCDSNAGRCVQNVTITSFCIDWDGYNVNENGWVNVTNGTSSTIYHDYCNGNTPVEAICNGKNFGGYNSLSCLTGTTCNPVTSRCE